MSGEQFVVRGRRVVTGEGVREAAVVVRGGKVAAVVSHAETPSGLPVVDVGDKVVMPGVVDSHAHINEPGRTEWEGFETATRAAAAGGITTVVDMPLNSLPPTTTLAALKLKAEAAQGRCQVDHAFWGGVIPGNAGELEALIDAGISGFKCFLCPSGVDEFPHATREVLDVAMPILARRGVPLIVHAELESPVEGLVAGGDARTYRGYLESRPKRWENEAIRMMVGLARAHRCRVHIVHLSSAEALPVLREARREGLDVSVETCPHYLSFTAEEIEDGATHFKCAPPIREAENRERLWAGLAQGDIELVVSDHSPCTPALKHLDRGDFGAAWGGIASLQLSLPAVWTEAKRRSLGLESLVRWMCEAPARLVGLAGIKGTLAPGADADLVVFDPDASFAVEPQRLLHRHPITPYAGRTLTGVVEMTFLRGTKVFERGQPMPRPSGLWVRRPVGTRAAA
ncbi:allantoinase [Myxococcus xanthus]|uniref:allantoinase n=1 Tax=Myxococcus xanthus TaxID=34 RepID=A0AAE6G4X8_MYXXA|nr:allantoinase AllB [Myxococcus xanthus]QDE70770.1 allantoinase [Myxococcus xanthus]QDE78049.1 allantoinase [Myxococcus xanthus]